jgi:PAS domain S-box-containing protein
MAVMLAAAAVTYNLTNRMVNASAWVSHTHEVLKEINATSADLADLESGQRGYIITGDELMLKKRRDDKANVRQDIAEIRRLTSDNPSQQERLDGLEPLVVQRIAFGDNTIDVRRQRDFVAAAQMIATGKGVGLSGNIQRQLDEMRTEEYRLLVKRQMESTVASTAVFLLLPLGVFLSMAMLSVGLFLLNVDVRERKEAVAISEQLAAIVESSDDAIIGKDLQGVVTSWNAGAERTFGYAAHEMEGQPIMRLIPKERQREETEIIDRIRQGQSVRHFETVRLRKDGRPIEISVTVSPIKDDRGRIIGASKVARDITERRKAEDKIRELNADLERRVEERTAQLETANKELEAFSYSVSHDLRAPLRGMDSFAQMLQEDCAERLDAEGKRMLNVVSSEAKRMGQLIDDLLAFSRLGRQQMENISIDMSVLARTAFESVAATACTSVRMVRFELKSIPPARGDLALLRQVFANLIGNAVKYSSKQAAPVVEVGGWSGDGETTYYVKDNGVGFDEKFSHKLFGVFQRLHSEEEFEGTGVGLAIVQRVIHRHGGKVRAESRLGSGAAFYFTLPI